MQRSAFSEIYTMMRERVGRPGLIKTGEAWNICRKSKWGFTTISDAMRVIMNSMVADGKAVKVRKGLWNIIDEKERSKSKNMKAKVLISFYSTGFDCTHRIYMPADYEQAEKDLEILKSNDHMKTWELQEIEIYNFNKHSFLLSGRRARYRYNGIEYTGVIQHIACIPLASGTRDYVPFDHYIIIPDGSNELHQVNPLTVKEILNE
jgi:hypothetical protein